MAKLHISLDGNSLGEYPLKKERITIGRRPANDIHIDNLAVSGVHAVITTLGGDSFLEDLNSTNGTIVNHKSIKKHVLQHADVIKFGHYQIRYENIEQEKKSGHRHGFENTVVLRPPTKPSASLSNAGQETEQDAGNTPTIKVADIQASDHQLPPQAMSPPSPPIQAEPSNHKVKMGRLQVLSGSSSGRELVLNKALTTFGEPGIQVVVITKRPHGYFLAHVEGEKRPLINGQHTGSQAHELLDRDVIDLVGVKMAFYLA